MGKIFSRPVRSLAIAPLLDGSAMSSDTLPPSSAQRENSTSQAAVHHGPSPGQGLMIENRRPNSMAGASQSNISPSNTVFTRTEQEGSTPYDNVGSVTSPTLHTRGFQSGDTRGLSLDSRFSEVHRDTNQEVLRHRSFGDKEAVQIVCGKLLKILNEAVASEQQVGNDETTISHESWIMEPYELIVHNQKRLQHHSSKLEDDVVAKKHFELLLRFLEYQQPGAWKKREEVRLGQCKKVLFRHLWLLYPPGTTVFRKDDDVWRAYKIEKSETITDNNQTVLRVYGWFLDFSKFGDVLIPHRETFDIPSFSSERPVSDLGLIPDWFIKPTGSPRQELIDRGKEYWSYHGEPSYREYVGDAWCQAPHDSCLTVIVDYSTSSRCVQPDSITSPRCTVCIGSSLGLKSYSDTLDTPVHSHTCINSMTATNIPFKDAWTHNRNATLFCPPKLWAFSLRFKTWKLISHHDLREVKRDEEPFQNELYMDSVKKNSLSGIVSSYFRRSASISDSHSPTRRERVNILLFGSSGTGKTFTAECLSRKFGLALYTMTCGDLGTAPNALDQKLQETFTRATNWNAMVLLDDVDMYGYDREHWNHERSALVSTFLRHLEYSECLTFITMVSPNGLDSAFPSRIHLAVMLPEFNLAMQQHMWTRMIDSLQQDSASTKDLTQFVKNELFGIHVDEHKPMNAREIQYCMDVAVILAQDDGAGVPVKPHHIETVLALGKDFGAYVKQDKGKLQGFPFVE